MIKWNCGPESNQYWTVLEADRWLTAKNSYKHVAVFDYVYGYVIVIQYKLQMCSIYYI